MSYSGNDPAATTSIDEVLSQLHLEEMAWRPSPIHSATNTDPTDRKIDAALERNPNYPLRFWMDEGLLDRIRLHGILRGLNDSSQLRISSDDASYAIRDSRSSRGLPMLIQSETNMLGYLTQTLFRSLETLTGAISQQLSLNLGSAWDATGSGDGARPDLFFNVGHPLYRQISKIFIELKTAVAVPTMLFHALIESAENAEQFQLRIERSQGEGHYFATDNYTTRDGAGDSPGFRQRV